MKKKAYEVPRIELAIWMEEESDIVTASSGGLIYGGEDGEGDSGRFGELW